MSFYDDMQNIATDILTEFNQGVIEYVELRPGTGPKDNPGPPTPITHRMMGTANGVAFKYVASGMALKSDMQVIASVDQAYVPTDKDKIRIDGKEYKIVEIIAKPSAGTPSAYLYIVRRGT